MRKRTGILLAFCLALLGVLLVSPKGVSAANGPCKDAESCAYIQTEGEVIGINEWGLEDKINNYIYISDYLKKYNDNYTTNIPKGMSYNEKTTSAPLRCAIPKPSCCTLLGFAISVVLPSS